MTQSIPIFQVDAFASRLFEGNPAAVCLMNGEVPSHILQSIAAENNLAETAFIWAAGDHYSIRWFTPTIEVDLCGHATLAGAAVLFKQFKAQGHKVTFESRSGLLHVTREHDERLVLDFPMDEYQVTGCPDGVKQAIGTDVLECIRGKVDFLVRIENETILGQMTPDFALIKKIPSRGLIVTAPGDKVDFVSRCFFPQSGIEEDPVTGSAHTTLTPYWANLLGKTTFHAKQLSSRGGELFCSLKDNRVMIGGYAQFFLEGFIHIEG